MQSSKSTPLIKEATVFRTATFGRVSRRSCNRQPLHDCLASANPPIGGNDRKAWRRSPSSAYAEISSQ